MSPTEITTIAKLIDLMGGWPIGLLLFVAIISPWVVMIYLVRSMSAASTENEKRAAERAAAHDLKSAENLAALTKIAEAGWAAYKDNVDLVKETQVIAKQTLALAEQLAEMIHLNTQAQTVLTSKIDNNQFCPRVRENTGK